jgi:hypothetical protein
MKEKMLFLSFFCMTHQILIYYWGTSFLPYQKNKNGLNELKVAFVFFACDIYKFESACL